MERFMRQSGRDFKIILTKGPGDALDIVRNLPLAENDVTVAAGGDGTCNELANALLALMKEQPKLVKAASRVLKLSGYMERLGDHITN
ncbi:MAG: hypothetical protein FWB99_04305, partial [Treponema sp.]|nr:hypothetical protein [Treponema sp.]